MIRLKSVVYALLLFPIFSNGQNVGINVANPEKDLHIRNMGTETAIRLDGIKSANGFTYSSVLGSPSGLSNIPFDNNQDWVDLDHNKLLASDDVKISSPSVSQFTGGTDILKVSLDFPSIPANAVITDVTLLIEWAKTGPSNQVINCLNMYLQQVSNDTFLYDFGLQNLISNIDQQVAISYVNEFVPIGASQVNSNNIYLSIYPLQTAYSPDGSMTALIDQIAVQIEYRIPVVTNENVAWSSGIKEGTFVISNSTDMSQKNFIAIEESGIVQVKGFKMAKNAGAGRVLTSNTNGRASWSDLPSNIVSSVNDLTDGVSDNNNLYVGHLSGLEGDTGTYNTSFGVWSQRDGINSFNNTSVGHAALANNTNGNRNVAIGKDAMTYSVLASDNIAVGYKAMENNDVGLKNLAIGNSALRFNIDGDDNIGIGDNALYNTISNENIAIGKEAMYFNKGGQRNTAIGFRSMFYASDLPSLISMDNTAMGYESMRGSDTPTDNTGKVNTAIGFQSMRQLSAGNFNTSLGGQALYNNTGHSANTAIGYRSMYYAYSGPGFISTNNTALGAYALEGGTDASLNSGYRNVAIGVKALNANTTGDNNVGIGMEALEVNTEGSDNVGIGYRSLYSNTSGGSNISIGPFAMNDNTTGSQNSAIGFFALSDNLDGNFNAAFGANSLIKNTSGISNTAIGANALENIISSSGNTALGRGAGSNISSGTQNVYIGSSAGGNNTGFTNNQVTVLGSSSTMDVSRTNVTMLGFGLSSSLVPADNQVAIGNTSVTEVRSAVSSFTTYSDRRIKYNIDHDVKGLDFINRLEPVIYNQDPGILYDIWGHQEDEELGIDHSDIKSKKFIGFIAQDVEQAALESGWVFPGVNPPTSENDAYTVRYMDFLMPMTKAIQELSQENRDLKNENEQLENRLSILEARLTAIEVSDKD